VTSYRYNKINRKELIYMMIDERTINELNEQLKGLSFYNEWYSECCNNNLFGLAATVGTCAQDLPRSLSNFLKARGQEVSSEDSRYTYIILTKKGKDFKPIFEKISNDLNDMLYKNLSMSEADKLEQILKKVI